MADLTSSVTISVQAATEVLTETTDIVLLPANTGADYFRELHYPGDVLPPLIYAKKPDKWENFDSAPLTGRPLVKGDMNISGALIAVWPGYLPDRLVREYWQSGGNKMAMTLDFFRSLWNYFNNPPSSGYITWYPRDRTTSIYNIIIASLTVGGQDIVSLDYLALYGGYVMQEVCFSFYIVSEVV